MDSDAGPPTEFARVRRLPGRAVYDRATVHGILDAAMIGHVGVVRDGRPVVIPMLFGRVDNDLYLHGSVASQLLRGVAGGIDLCFTATLIDGLVFARSAFHHSMNYRSVVIVGTASSVEGDEKLLGLRAIVEHITPGRWDEARRPTDLELRQTAAVRMPIEEASAKIRVGGPADDLEDLGLPIWAGQVPVTARFASPLDADDLHDGIGVSPAVSRLGRPDAAYG
ncbi:MAG TPA: pyridoxamine 5'-phosphate oxidase family protein [Acidimicrobiales bacterium]|nr:pyridoxamine 5'-phosphate oxidase family protein [Acidimicrobiales bacterium]